MHKTTIIFYQSDEQSYFLLRHITNYTEYLSRRKLTHTKFDPQQSIGHTSYFNTLYLITFLYKTYIQDTQNISDGSEPTKKKIISVYADNYKEECK